MAKDLKRLLKDKVDKTRKVLEQIPKPKGPLPKTVKEIGLKHRA